MIYKYLLYVIIPVLLNLSNVLASGEGAVITLEFPAGAENTALGETGVSVANTVSSTFWNPANVACLYDETYLNLIFTYFHEDLLPSFGIPDLYHNFTAFSTTLNNVFPNIDIGYAFFRNYVNMDKITLYRDTGETEIIVDSKEKVISNTLGIRVFKILSIGASFKEYDSRLAPGYGGEQRPDDGIAKGRAFDLGIRINKKLEFAGLFYISPAIGASLLNIGNDSAQYIKSSGNKDPLPKLGMAGVSCEFNALELFGYTGIYEISYNLLTKPNERTKHHGHKFQITPFYYLLHGKMIDSAGLRFEKNSGHIISFNLQKTYMMFKNLVRVFDLLNKTDNFSRVTKWEEKLNLKGFELKPNLFFSKCYSSIIDGNDAREGQKREEWTAGFGIVAKFPELFNKKTD
ncbi:MAG TPA: hypothetical protein VKY57_13325 [Chitinispirillaceae bacterium]|nr:hypothetical protein [Chitinispirillaceae bacterium]